MPKRIIALGRQRQIDSVTTHGMYKTDEYLIWIGMKQRCDNPNNSAYKNYGKRGITYSSRWNDFLSFLHDMGKRPSRQHSLERVNNNDSYHPSNCKWATKEEQCNNTRQNNNLTHNGITMTVTQWARHIGVEPTVIFKRLNRMKWSVEKTLTTPVGRGRPKSK